MGRNAGGGRMEGYWLLLGVVAISVWIMSGYNQLQSLSQRIGESRSNIENSLADGL